MHLIQIICLVVLLPCNVALCEMDLDSIRYITALPDYNDGSLGDSISEKIIKKGKVILPKLIEKIKDTTKIRTTAYSGVYDWIEEYTISDVAIILFDWIAFDSAEYVFPIEHLLRCEFYRVDGPWNHKLLYYRYFCSEDKKYNYKNRLRFYNRVKRWYNEGKKFGHMYERCGK